MREGTNEIVPSPHNGYVPETNGQQAKQNSHHEPGHAQVAAHELLDAYL
jgi:hypothetical protein